MFTISHPYFAGPGGMDMASMMAGMGGDKPDMDDLDGDSDDEDLPDLEQKIFFLLHLQDIHTWVGVGFTPSPL